MQHQNTHSKLCGFKNNSAFLFDELTNKFSIKREGLKAFTVFLHERGDASCEDNDMKIISIRWLRDIAIDTLESICNDYDRLTPDQIDQLTSNYASSMVCLRGQYEFNQNDDSYISTRLSVLLAKLLIELDCRRFKQYGEHIAGLIHSMSAIQTESTLHKTRGLLKAALGSHRPGDIIDNLRHLVLCLNIRSTCLPELLMSQDNQGVTSKAMVKTPAIKDMIPELSELDDVLKLLGSDTSSRELRLILAKYRRFDIKVTSPINSTTHSASPEALYSLANKLVEEFMCTSSIESYYKLCILSKLFLSRVISLEVYKKILPNIRQLSAEKELTFLASASLDALTLSRLRLSGDTTIKSRQLLSSKPTSLSKYFKRLIDEHPRTIFHKIVDAATVPSLDAVVTIATTDNKNQFDYLRASIGSIINQTCAPKELRIYIDPVNDHHDTAESIARICHSFSRISVKTNKKNDYELQGVRVLVHENKTVRGQYFARNHAANNSACKFFFNQDDDDFSVPHRLELQAKSLMDGALICYGKHLRLSEYCSIQQDSRLCEFWGDGIATLACPRTIICANPFLEVRSRGDIEFRDRILRRYSDDAISNIDETLMLMRGSPSTVSSDFEHSANTAYQYFQKSIDSSKFYLRR